MPGVEGEVVLDALLSQNGTAGCHIAHDGHPVRRFLRLRDGRRGGMGQGDGPSFSGADLNETGIRQLFQMEVDGGGGPQAHGLANLPDRRGIPLRLDAGGNVIIDPLLHGRKHEMTSILLAASGSCAGAMYLTVSIPYLFLKCKHLFYK